MAGASAFWGETTLDNGVKRGHALCLVEVRWSICSVHSYLLSSGTLSPCGCAVVQMEYFYPVRAAFLFESTYKFRFGKQSRDIVVISGSAPAIGILRMDGINCPALNFVDQNKFLAKEELERSSSQFCLSNLYSFGISPTPQQEK